MSRRLSAVRSQLLEEFAETDLNKLQQQYGRAERAKQAYTEKTQGLLHRDKQEIQRLQDEREALLRSGRVSDSCFSLSTDVRVVQELTDMLDRRDKIDEELEAEKAKAASLKDQIYKWERMFAELRTGGGTTHCSMKSEINNLLKNTCLIENKLYRGRKRFNMLMTRNEELREELKTLQVEKKQFLHVQSRLQKELHAIRKDICNLMTKCTEAFNASVKMQERQTILRDHNAKDVSQYIKERSNLEREISHHCNYEAFLDIKAIAHNKPDIDHRKVEKQTKLESKKFGLEDFEDAIKKILRETEESNLDKLVRNFIQMEEQNYTLLNFVNYQHNEAEAIRKQISQLCHEKEIFAAEKRQRQEQHQALQMRVSNKQEAAEQQLAVHQQRIEFMEKLLDQLKQGIKSLLQLSHETSVICSQLGTSDGVDIINEYLGMVVDRVNELLTLQSYLHFQENLSQWDIDSLSTIAGQLLGITPPSVNMTTAAATSAPDDDTDLVESVLLEAKEPVSREDLLTLVKKGIQRRKKADRPDVKNRCCSDQS